jgi:hypothetical protein
LASLLRLLSTWRRWSSGDFGTRNSLCIEGAAQEVPPAIEPAGMPTCSLVTPRTECVRHRPRCTLALPCLPHSPSAPSSPPPTLAPPQPARPCAWSRPCVSAPAPPAAPRWPPARAGWLRTRSASCHAAGRGGTAGAGWGGEGQQCIIAAYGTRRTMIPFLQCE